MAFRAVTFDCFGTLIDWKRGMTRVLEQLPSLRDHHERLPEVLEARGTAEIRLEAGEFQPYARILSESIGEACRSALGVELTDAERRAFAYGQLGWPAFPDTPPALARLAQEIPVGLLSNCDAQTLAVCATKHLGAPIAFFVSAEAVRSYKPAPAHWQKALEITSAQPSEILHVSFTREYDLDPARQLGFPLGFVARYGTPRPDDIETAFDAEDLEDLVGQILAA